MSLFPFHKVNCYLLPSNIEILEHEWVYQAILTYHIQVLPSPHFLSTRKSRSEQPSPSDLGGILDVPSKPGKAIVTLTNLQVEVLIFDGYLREVLGRVTKKVSPVIFIN